MLKKTLTVMLAAALAFSITSAAFAGDQKDTDEHSKRMMKATETLKEVVDIPEDGIPKSMLENAAAIVVIPGLIKASFVVGGKHGNGVMSVRNESGWSHPSFVSMTGGSIGWQAGVKSTDLVLVFMSKRNVKDLIDGEFTLGADASVAAGPVGREVGAGTNLPVQAEVYAYSRSRGAFAGISLDGSKLGIDNDANTAYYGKGTKAGDLLFGKHPKAPEQAEGFTKTVSSLAG